MILTLFTIIYIGGYFIPENMPLLYGLSYEFLIVLLCLCCFIKTSYIDCINKAGWFCMTTWTAINLVMFTWFSKPCIINVYILAFESILFVSMIIYSQLRSYDFDNNEYNELDTFIIFKKPKSFLDFLHSFIFAPVSSVSVASQGFWFGYTLNKPYRCETHCFDENNIYIKVNINNKIVLKELEPILLAHWGFRNNCCHAVQRLFPNIKFSIMDSLPCYFVNTIIKAKNDTGK